MGLDVINVLLRLMSGGANNTNQGKVTIQVVPLGGQIYVTDASGSTWSANLQLMQVVPPNDQICTYCLDLQLMR